MADANANFSTVLLIARPYAIEQELSALKLVKLKEDRGGEHWYVNTYTPSGNADEDRYYRLVWGRGDVIQRFTFGQDFFGATDVMNLVAIYGGRFMTASELKLFRSGKDPLFEKRRQSYDTPFL